jgi:hypothetical protein
LNVSGGPLEGYIAVAVLLGPLSRTGKFGTSDEWEVCLILTAMYC